jgi:hypothetical protein
MNKHLTGSVAAAAAGFLALGLAAPASAASIGVKDPADVSHGVDLRAVRVVNGDHNVRVVTSHTNLRRDFRTGSGGSVYLDTDRSDKGPELVFVGGYFEGTDYALLRTEGFGAKQWGNPVRGSYEMNIDYDKEQVRMRIGRGIKALEGVGDVRVAVKVAGNRTDGTTVVDWLGEPRSFTPWVAKG